ncbi:adhesion G protein-coupled receptor L3-like isoform X2 [Acropora palmata]|uniref:adhesion G protein-coupled receptor L3-like isoform X2 n=1 Tax=Acropora palmata TaxID=6131 RepID=UPI003DA04A85
MLYLAILTLALTFCCPGYGNIRLFNQRTLNTNNGDTLKLQCTNRDIKFIRNLRRLTWQKDGTRIQDADPRLNVISRNYLLIRQVREQDAGVYNCTVEAATFLSINITDLRVIGKDPVVPISTLPPVRVPSTAPPSTSAVPSTAVTVATTNSQQPSSPQRSSSLPSSQQPSSQQPSSQQPSSLQPSSLQPSSREPSSQQPSSRESSSQQPSSREPSSQQPSFYQRLDLQQKVADLWTGNSSDVSSLITELVNFTTPTPRSQKGLTSDEISSSLDVLAQLVNLNSKRNNSAINSTRDRENIVQTASNLLEAENLNTWLGLLEVRNNVTDELLKVMDDFASQLKDVLESSKNISSLVILTKNVGLRTDRLETRQKLYVDFSEYGTAISIPSQAFSSDSTSHSSIIVYKTLNNILELRKSSVSKDGTGAKRIKSGSSIISAKIFPRPADLTTERIRFVFQHSNKTSSNIGQCVFWEIGVTERAWLTRGCSRVERESNSRLTTCECNHLTIFAVLMTNKPVEAHHQSLLHYLSILGCACSLFFLLLTLIVIVICWKRIKGPRISLMLHLCLAIAASCTLILVTGFVRWEGLGCLVNAALLHFFLLCVFSWMLCHGGIFYYLIIRAELLDKLKPKLKWSYVFGWGFPALIVAASLGVTGTENYAADNCWLSLENGLIYWAFVAPTGTVVFVNSILFVFLLQRISRVSKFRDRMTRTQHVRAWLRRSSVLLPVLGITWSFGFLTFISSTTVFHYLFTVFNTLQGFIIFVNFCVIDTEMRKALIRELCKWQYSPSLNWSKAGSWSKEQGNSQRIEKFPVKIHKVGLRKAYVVRQNSGFNEMNEIQEIHVGALFQQPKHQAWMNNYL